jgi:hypothetical protein
MMPFNLPPSPEGILTFNVTGRFAIWRPQGLDPRGYLTGLSEARMGAPFRDGSADVFEERWAVLGREVPSNDDIGPLPAGLAPRWGKKVSGKTLYVEGETDPNVTYFPAEFGHDNGTWSATDADFLALARAALNQHGGAKAENGDLLLFRGSTTVKSIDSPPNYAEHMLDGEPSRRVFDYTKGVLGADVGWLYQENPELEDGAIVRLVFHMFVPPGFSVPIEGALTKCNRDQLEGKHDLKALFEHVFETPEMLVDGALAWYRTEVSVVWGNGDAVKP